MPLDGVEQACPAGWGAGTERLQQRRGHGGEVAGGLALPLVGQLPWEIALQGENEIAQDFSSKIINSCSAQPY